MRQQLSPPERKRPDLILDSEADAGVSLGDIVQMFAAHKWFIVSCMLLSLLASALYVSRQQRLYEGMAIIRIDPGRASSLGLNDLVTAPNTDPMDALHTEIAILKSDGVAVQALQALSEDEMNRFAGVSKNRVFAKDDGTTTTVGDAVLNRFRGQLTVKQQEGTQLVEILFRDKDPRLAAAMANHVVDAYTMENLGSRDRSVDQLRSWLSSQMSRLKVEVETSQKKLADFQEANNIVGTPDTSNTTVDRLKMLNDSLTAAQSARIAKEAQMRAAESGNPEVLAALFSNPKLQSLQAEQGTLYAQYAQLSTKFGPKYPPLAEIKQQMNLIDGEIASDVRSVRDRLHQEYAAALSNENMLRGEYNQQVQRAYSVNRDQAEYSVLQGEVTSSRELYDTLQRKLQQASVDALINGLNTMLVDKARVPTVPVEPKPALTLASGLLLGLVAGIAATLIVEARSNKVQNLEKLQRITGFRVLGSIPRELGPHSGKNLRLGDGAPGQSMVTVSSPLSPRSEAYRGLRNALLSSLDARPRTFLFTSTLPGEDLAQAVVSLAVSLAQTGSRVLLVDADLRQPSLHTIFGLSNDSGLGDWFESGSQDRCFMRPAPTQKDLCVVVAGKRPALPPELLASDRFRELFNSWTEQFEYVVLKAAPLLVVNDAVPLVALLDVTIVVTRYGATRVKELMQVRKLLGETRSRGVGLLVSNVPPASSLQGEYGVYGKEYYA